MLNFSAERDFVYAHRRWRDKIKAIRIDMDHVPEDERHDGFENWWDRLSDLVGVLEGRGDVLRRVCEELGADWREVAAAWGIFVDSRLRRHDLPYVSSLSLNLARYDLKFTRQRRHTGNFITHAARSDGYRRHDSLHTTQGRM
jgi:nuclear pore complex protein Nup85